MKCYQCRKKLPEGCETCPKCGAVQIFSKELIDAAIHQDQDAITQLYQMTKDNVYFTIYSMEKKEDVVQDLLQDTYVKAFRSLSQLKEPAAFRSWIKRIAHNHTIDYLRKKKPALFTDMVSAESNEVLDFRDGRPDSYPETVIDQKETASLLKDILNSLSDEQRVAVSLHYYQQFSIKEIAEQLSVTENTIKSRLNYARRHIEKKVRELERQGTKLYGMLPFPFFLWLLNLGEDPGMFAIPDKEILSNILSSTVKSYQNPSVKGGNKAIAGAGKTAVAGAAKAGKGMFLAKIVGTVAVVAVVGITGLKVAKGLPNNNEPAPAVEQTTEAPEATTETKKTAKEAYEEVLQLYRDLCNMDNDKYHELYDSEFEIDNMYEEFRPINNIYMERYHSVRDIRTSRLADCHLGTYYYAYYDIDHNGTDELLIGNTGNLYTGTKQKILEIYTYDGESVHRVVGFDDSLAIFLVTDTDQTTWSNIFVGEDGAVFLQNRWNEMGDYGSAKIANISEDGYSLQIVEESESLNEQGHSGYIDDTSNEIIPFLQEHGEPEIGWIKLDELNTPEKDMDNYYGLYQADNFELDFCGEGIYDTGYYRFPFFNIEDVHGVFTMMCGEVIPAVKGNNVTLYSVNLMEYKGVDNIGTEGIINLQYHDDRSVTVSFTQEYLDLYFERAGDIGFTKDQFQDFVNGGVTFTPIKIRE